MREVLIIPFIVLILRQVSGVCFFGQDLQGSYLTQSTVSRGSEIKYSTVVIFQDSIPIWGRCHRRFGNNVILYDMAGSSECMRCFHIVSRSTHILEVHTEGLNRCYTNEGAALTKCPTEERIAENAAVEIMLYKTTSLVEDRFSQPVYCPIEGRFKVTYDLNDGTEADKECPEPDSILSNCPKGNRISIGFRRCSFADFEKTLECLGSWNGRDGQQFLALRDPSVDHSSPSRGPPAPKYRCAIYKRDVKTGRIFLSFSSDSTCFNNLRSSWEGFESLVLLPESKPILPQIVNRSVCEFPSWSQGQWEQLEVRANVMTFTDLTEFKTFSVHCIGSPSEDQAIYPVYTQSQCGDESYTCLAIKERSRNVFEFQISTSGKPFFEPSLCSDSSNLDWPRWITQGRVDRFRESPCPVAGEYTGTIPDETTFCAKLYSDCNNLEIMFYTVYACSNRSQIYEEREYRCLGQWSESGITYTYTERRDVIGYECFAGVVATSDEVFITEAGIDCKRGLRPLTHGMKLQKRAACQNKDPKRVYPLFPEDPNPRWKETGVYYSEVNNSLPNTPSQTSAASQVIKTTDVAWLWVICIIFLIQR